MRWLTLVVLFASVPARAAPEPLRRITHHLIDALESGTVTPPLARQAPLSCLGRPVHAPWQNPFSPLPAPMNERHVRMTLAAAEAVVEYRDAFLVEAPRKLAYDLVPLDRPRLELGYRLFSCGTGKSDVTLTVRVSDATGSWEQRVALELDRPKRSEREAFYEVAVDLPLAAGQPARLELELTPDKKGGDGVLVALAEPVVSGIDPGPATLADTNVLWIVIDSVRSDALGPSRTYTPTATPEIDRRVFARGTGFTRAYAMSNQTRTSTLAMIGSVAPSIGGFHSNSWAFTSGRRETFYAKDPPLITRTLMREGFRVAHLGHNHFLWNSEVIGLDNGFPRAVDFRGIPSDAVLASEAAARFFEEHRDERWFMMLNYTAPHTPYKPPEAWQQRAAEADFQGIGHLPKNYLGELMWVDHNLEGVFARLEALGLLERTLVIVTADHGEVMNPAHDCVSVVMQLKCNFNHSVTVYDDELNVPLGIALPGRVVARTITSPVSHADVPPTILDVLGLAPEARYFGRSLRPVLEGGPASESPIYADGRLASALRLGDWKLIVHAAQDDIRPRSRMIDGEAQKFELFDVAKDPLETENLAKARRDVVELLTQELKSLRVAMRARFEGLVPAGGAVALRGAERETTAKNRLMLVSDGAAHRLKGRARSAGSLRCPDPPAPGGMVCAADGDGGVTLDVQAPPGASLTIELTSSPWSAALDFDLTLDERPLPADRLRLGAWGLCLLPLGAALDATERLALAVSAGPPLPQPHEAAVYFWRSALVADGEDGEVGPAQALLDPGGTSPEDTTADPRADEHLGGEVKKILQDLGYTH